jgi:hypothetical protein
MKKYYFLGILLVSVLISVSINFLGRRGMNIVIVKTILNALYFYFTGKLVIGIANGNDKFEFNLKNIVNLAMLYFFYNYVLLTITRSIGRRIDNEALAYIIIGIIIMIVLKYWFIIFSVVEKNMSFIEGVNEVNKLSKNRNGDILLHFFLVGGFIFVCWIILYVVLDRLNFDMRKIMYYPTFKESLITRIVSIPFIIVFFWFLYDKYKKLQEIEA